MAAAMPLAFSVWSALLNNFVVERAGFTGVDIGWLQTVREIPGFLAVGAILVFLVMREQVRGAPQPDPARCATAATASFRLPRAADHHAARLDRLSLLRDRQPGLQLQWLSKAEAPAMLGKLVAMGSAASFVAYGLIVVIWTQFEASYDLIYVLGGLTTAAVASGAGSPSRSSRAGAAAQDDGRAPALLALLPAPGAGRGAAADLRGLRSLHDGGALPLRACRRSPPFSCQLRANVMLAPFIGRMVASLGERMAMGIEYASLLRSSSPMPGSTARAGACGSPRCSMSSTTCFSLWP